MRQQVVASSINGPGRYDMISLSGDVQKSICDGGCSRSQSQGSRSSFECRHALLENILGGIRQTAVDVACIFQTEACGCMGRVAEYIRCGLVDGDGPCTGSRIGLFLSCV